MKGIELFKAIEESKSFIRESVKLNPKVAVILGTGLGGLEKMLEVEKEIPYSDIPHFPISTVESHRGTMISGKLEGVPVLILSGRFHFYEGYSARQIAYPVRVVSSLGADHLFIASASGGLKEEFNAGDLVIINDHINLIPDNPLRGLNDERLGPRFPDMLTVYDPDLILTASQILDASGTRYHTGIYAALPGPSLETPAEYNFLHKLGASVVGMSTVPEVIAAKHLSMKIFVVAICSNLCIPTEKLTETTIQDVIETTSAAAPQVMTLFSELIKTLKK